MAEVGPVGSYDPRLHPTQAQYEAFSRIFGFFNEELFAGHLPQVMLTFSRRSNALGFFAPKRWSQIRDKEGAAVHEIALNPDHLTQDEMTDCISTVVHEMAHLWQESFGAPSRRGYHNKEWAAQMERIGLMPSDTGHPGGKKTGQSVSHYIIEGGVFQVAFERMPKSWWLPFVAGVAAKSAKPSQNSSKTKFVCAGCDSKVWGRPDLRIMCLDCRIQFLPEDEVGQRVVAPEGSAK
ncbi:MAG TPA: SprT-like domain-containing protein [Polyangiaceae bacterium]|nr:SprT-like domain-containing protein [Polyangiaceae bacterium]